MRTFDEVITQTHKKIADHYCEKLNIIKDADDVDPRPDGIMDMEDKLLRRELIVAAEIGNTSLAAEIAQYLEREHGIILFAGWVSMMKLGPERKKDGTVPPTYYLGVTEKGRSMIQLLEKY